MVKRMVQQIIRHILLLVVLLSTSVSAQQSHTGKAMLATGAAFAPDGTVWIVGVDEAGLFLQQQDGQWGARRYLAINDETVSTLGDNRPKIAFGTNGQAVVTYTRPLSRPYTGEIRMLRSEDGAQNFSAPFTVHADRQVITHRFESIMFDARGDLYTFWLDKRDAERTWQANKGDKSSYEGAAIYANISHDGGRTFGPDLKVADSSCECCRIALAANLDGGVAALWRHVYAGSVRDHAFAGVRVDTVPSLSRASYDNWVLKACPHHGPGLAMAAGGGYHAVWFGEKDGLQRVRYGQLDARGRPRGRVRDVPDPQAEHADVASTGKFVVVVWRSFDGKASHIEAWLSHDGGKRFVQSRLLSSELDNDHPRLIARDGKVAVVWRTEKETYVHTFTQ